MLTLLFWLFSTFQSEFCKKSRQQQNFSRIPSGIFFSDGMVASLETLSLIVEGNELKETFMEDPMLKEMKPYLMKLNLALGLVHGKGDFGSTLGIKVEEYDADTEGMDEHKHGKK